MVVNCTYTVLFWALFLAKASEIPYNWWRLLLEDLILHGLRKKIEGFSIKIGGDYNSLLMSKWLLNLLQINRTYSKAIWIFHYARIPSHDSIKMSFYCCFVFRIISFNFACCQYNCSWKLELYNCVAFHSKHHLKLS